MDPGNIRRLFVNLIRGNEKYLFYFSLSIPLIWYLMEDRQWPIYGFTALLIMTLKDEKQAIRLEGKGKVLGGLLIISSFLTPFLKPLLGVETRYTSLEYALYVSGFVVIFYGLSAVRHFLSPIGFLAAVSSFLHFSEYFEGFFNSFVPALMYVVTGLLNFSGITTNFQGNILELHGSRSLVVYIATSCVGVYSIFIFSLVIIILFSNTKGPLPWKVGLAIIGFIGTFFVNCLRIYLICLVGTQWSLQLVELFHSAIGYFLFIAWILLFEYAALSRLPPLQNLHKN